MQDSPEFENYFQYIQETFNQGTSIPPLLPDLQLRIKTHLSTSEETINSLFPNAIQDDRIHVSLNIQFLDTSNFFQTAILRGRSEFLDNKYIKLDMLNKTIDTSGMSEPGKNLFIHTTYFQYDDEHKAFKIRQLSETEGTFVARHELMHTKLTENTKTNDTGETEIDRGCRIQVTKDGKLISQKHNALYEAQTDVLAVISSHPDSKSWKEILSFYIQEKLPDTSQEQIAQVESLCSLLEYTFTDFSEARNLLGNTYFQSDGQAFFSSIRAGINAKGNPEKLAIFEEFYKSSETDQIPEMKTYINALIK